MRVGVIGTGYVGLVVGAGLAEMGNDVICADIDERKVAVLNAGEVPIYEPGLEPLVARNLEEGRLRFTTELDHAIRESDILFIAVSTPEGEAGSADLRHVLDVATTIGRHMNGRKVVITKSTVPVGTAALVAAAIGAETEHEVHVCSNPEFLKEGAAVDDFMKPDRVVIGVDSAHAREVLEELYDPFVRTGNPILFMDVSSAEITKYAANAMLATRISFMNMIARLCAAVGADVDQVRAGVGSDARIGPAFLFPGVGYGGSCFPKDVKALVRTLNDAGIDAGILDAVERVNADQKNLMVDAVVDHFGEDLTGRTFAIWGLSFKPGTDDMREATSLVVIDGLLARGARIQAHDPEAMDAARRVLGDRVQFTQTNYDAVHGADALLVVTEWPPYRRPDFQRLRTMLSEPVVFDGRNVFDPVKMAALGFEYWSVGRPVAGSAGSRKAAETQSRSARS
jgi:UDPglucose 6-dehydrogenase